MVSGGRMEVKSRLQIVWVQIALVLGCALVVHGAQAEPDDYSDPERSYVKRVAVPPPKVRSHIALIYDEQTQSPLFDKNAEQVVPIASITKLMTAMVMLDAMQPLDEEVSVEDDNLNKIKRAKSRLPIGLTLTRGELLRLALMASENRAASALARSYPGGTEAMVAAMNDKARELGMANTRFVGPTGLDKGNVSTANDLVRMIAAARSYPLIRQYSTATSYSGGQERARAALRQHQPAGQERLMGHRPEQDRLYPRVRPVPGDGGEHRPASGDHRAAQFLGQAHPSRRCEPH